MCLRVLRDRLRRGSYSRTLLQARSGLWLELIHDFNPSQLGEAQWCILPISGGCKNMRGAA